MDTRHNYNGPQLFDGANPRRFTQIMIDGYHWVKKRLPSAGAGQYAYDSLALSETTPIGPGVRQRLFWQTTRHALTVDFQQAAVTGMGGVIHGQFFSQPLYDPYNGTYGNQNSQS